MASSEITVHGTPGPFGPTGQPLSAGPDGLSQTGEQLTTANGLRLPDTDHSLKAGERGPSLLEDFHLREKITHFDHERIPGAISKPNYDISLKIMGRLFGFLIIVRDDNCMLTRSHISLHQCNRVFDQRIPRAATCCDWIHARLPLVNNKCTELTVGLGDVIIHELLIQG